MQCMKNNQLEDVSQLAWETLIEGSYPKAARRARCLPLGVRLLRIEWIMSAIQECATEI